MVSRKVSFVRFIINLTPCFFAFQNGLANPRSTPPPLPLDPTAPVALLLSEYGAPLGTGVHVQVNTIGYTKYTNGILALTSQYGGCQRLNGAVVFHNGQKTFGHLTEKPVQLHKSNSFTLCFLPSSSAFEDLGIAAPPPTPPQATRYKSQVWVMGSEYNTFLAQALPITVFVQNNVLDNGFPISKEGNTLAHDSWKDFAPNHIVSHAPILSQEGAFMGFLNQTHNRAPTFFNWHRISSSSYDGLDIAFIDGVAVSNILKDNGYELTNFSVEKAPHPLSQSQGEKKQWWRHCFTSMFTFGKGGSSTAETTSSKRYPAIGLNSIVYLQNHKNKTSAIGVVVATQNNPQRDAGFYVLAVADDRGSDNALENFNAVQRTINNPEIMAPLEKVATTETFGLYFLPLTEGFADLEPVTFATTTNPIPAFQQMELIAGNDSPQGRDTKTQLVLTTLTTTWLTNARRKSGWPFFDPQTGFLVGLFQDDVYNCYERIIPITSLADPLGNGQNLDETNQLLQLLKTNGVETQKGLLY